MTDENLIYCTERDDIQEDDRTIYIEKCLDNIEDVVKQMRDRKSRTLIGSAWAPLDAG